MERGQLCGSLPVGLASPKRMSVTPAPSLPGNQAITMASAEDMIESSSMGRPAMSTTTVLSPALFRALTSGERDFVAIALVAAVEGGPTPCGACRQLLAEYASDATVWTAHPDHLDRGREFSVGALLPAAFLDFQPDK